MQGGAMYIGKIIGALIGIRFGLPGVLAGLALGHLVDTWLAGHGFARWQFGLGGAARRQQLFTESVVALSAKLAKVDGPVTRAEVDAFKLEFRIRSDQLRAVGVLYDRAKQTAAGYEPYARRLGDAFADAPVLLAAVLEALTRIALSDGPMQPSERDFLAAVATAFHAQSRTSNGGVAAGSGADDPYAVLGVSRSASMEEIKAAWRELTRQHHPDTLIAKGLPQDYVELATRKMATINAAYDRIRMERGES